ncbi:2-hydroxyacyl-CoA dehydratase family protein [Aquamicrobium zhengzhouense]|uniref:2-hydroxyacyl-CoA dehydratase n=1 Tax=Aquamicrobium zhengzhouense TaxID=2781738 RepID=A0ABS0SG67_9HYPH|nr:2-hydroxyacyl-CoA dehydratase family protein [Aquamicrobium zhengzhouense]MBI1621789.1 2-hydroxyacyl-CoA dehydratase [Aquamicrobium zhengzhouense]
MSEYLPLECSRAATDYQREWAKGLRRDITSGKSYAFVNADTPHELFHHMGMPIVTNQWWSAIIAAKQLSEFYFDYMESRGFHERLARYSSLPLIAELEGDTSRQPWGGLPTPSILCARQSADDHQKIFSLWAERTGAPLALLSSPAVPDPQPDWWRLARDDWETLYGSDRLDLMVAEFEVLIAQLEEITGRTFDRSSFASYMEAINEQERIFEEASALIAQAPRCPIRISEQMPNVMIPQWHRGSDWAISHAKRFRDELTERVQKGVAVVPDERIRMMWIGAGLWFDTGFYSAFEESHGAVFAWSMYLPFAADGYIREDKGDPLRTLAARVSAMNEQLHQPPWINAWMVEQARRYRIDVALMLIPEHDRFSGHGSLYAKQALEEAGVRVIEVWSDMVDPRQWDRDAMVAKVTPVLDDVLAEKN